MIPNNYQESSYPESTFIWEVENTGNTAAGVSLMFTFKNGTGESNDLGGGHSIVPIDDDFDGQMIQGLELKHIHRHPKPLEPGQKLSDQTYDVWSAEGPSAYSGGLWLACLQAGAALAAVMENFSLASDYMERFKRAQKVYEKNLWNGEYYDYDSSKQVHHDSVMGDKLAGHWFSLACGLGGVVTEDHAHSSLKKVFEHNVMGFENGRFGAMNSMRPDGTLDRTALQSIEIWTGTTFSLAAAMLQAGLSDEAFRTARGIFNMVYEDYGLWFQTPEALSAFESVRAISYMRPLAVWAIQWELDRM